MVAEPKNTLIKETAFDLAHRFGWDLEYNGGLELDGEYLDDADLVHTITENGASVEYILNISYAESTSYGFTLTRERLATQTSGSAFGAVRFEASGLPGENAVTLVEKYYLATANELKEAAAQAMGAVAY